MGSSKRDKSSSSKSDGGSQSSGKAKEVQGQVDEVAEIMNDNINKVMERGEKLDSLESKTSTLVPEI